MKKAASRKPTQPPQQAAVDLPPLPQPPGAFPIVGIGASAGGLEALEQFFSAVPPDCGMAFVVIQHLDPTYKGILPELLQRKSTLTVQQVSDSTVIEPNFIYVIPPNRDMSILHGVLHLFEPTAARGLRLPIDHFLRSLAEDQEERSIGILLSGMGTDGTLGLRAIKEQAGVVLVQEPETAKFDGMPRSAIDADLVDIVAPAGELYARLVEYLQHAGVGAVSKRTIEAKTQSSLDKIAILLRAHSGHDFSLYKKSTLYRRIERRMHLHQIDKIQHYVNYLQDNSKEQDLLFKELLIGVTSFFRDPAAWKQLQDQVFPALLASRPAGGQLRAWVVGCSTGEEAYSLAICFREVLARDKPPVPYSLQIFATDLDRDAIDKARTGAYPENIEADVSPERLQRFFVREEGGGYRVNKEIRQMLTLAPQNVIMDPPFTRLDLLICRNLLIYLAPELQRKLIPLFHYSLSTDGFLFLGSAETIGSNTDLFVPVDSKWRIYRRKELIVRRERPEVAAPVFPAVTRPREAKPAGSPVNLQTLADQVLLQKFAPPGVIVNDQGDILYINGRTGKYLEPAAGRADWNVFAMAREGLRPGLTTAFRQVVRQQTQEPVTLRSLQVKTNGDYERVDVTLAVLQEPTALRGLVLVVFAESEGGGAEGALLKNGQASGRGPEQTNHERDLQHLREELQSLREEMQTSQEELKSANEELQSTNEELQSTNEELTTSREEMQSLNEELQTVNAELQVKVEELSLTNSDMKNLLNSLDIATLFLDGDLRLRRFTTQASRLIKLIPTDVGRPVTDIASSLVYSTLAEDVAAVLQSLMPVEKQLLNQDGRWFSVRIMPYRTLENKIDGVVIVFLDITTLKQMEAELRRTGQELKTLLETNRADLHQGESAQSGDGSPAQPSAPA